MLSIFKRTHISAFLFPLALTFGASSASAGICGVGTVLTNVTTGVTVGGGGGCTFLTLNYNTQLTGMSMSVNGLVIPGGPAFAPVTVNMVVGLNPSQPSLGHAQASGFASGPGGTVATGDRFFVDSFFDVFFDLALTPTDTSNGLLFGVIPNGVTVHLDPPFSAHMENQYFVDADTSRPQDGLVPPPATAPYIGHLDVAIPLGLIDPANGLEYEFAFKLAQHNVNGSSATFITLPDGSVQDTMDSAGYLSAGLLHVGDTFDPPFTVGNQTDPFNGSGALTGPTTAVSQFIPEPSGLFLLAGGLVALAVRRRLA